MKRWHWPTLRKFSPWLMALALFGGAAQAMAEQPRIAIQRVPRPPMLDDFAGMQPAADLKATLASVSGFIQRFPKDGEVASQRTDAYFGYDDHELYVIFVCFDSEAAKVRAGMARREDILNDDTVWVYLDTFNDKRRAYFFQSNPLGIQYDALWTEGVSRDSSFDAVWQSEGRMTEEGYIVIMSFPWKHLRFPPPENHEWGVILGRFIPRNNESSFWPRVPADAQGYLKQAAALTGLTGITSGRNIQLIPYGLGRAFRTEETSDGREFTGGIDGKFVIKDTFSIDATVNPDFAQIESDQPQVTVNRRFEAFFPEKRPFFTENAGFFRTPITLLFTRRIIDPGFGLRMTGKAGDWTIGGLVADDRAPGEGLASDDPEAGKDARIEVLRLNRDLGKQSTLGAFFSSRSFAGSSDLTGSLDTGFKLNDQWSATMQAVGSKSTASDGTSASGQAYDTTIQRSGKSLTLVGSFRAVSPDFSAPLGFIPRTDYRDAYGYAGYYFHPKNGTVVMWGPSMNIEQTWTFAGGFSGNYGSVGMDFEFPHAIAVGGFWSQEGDRLAQSEFPGINGFADFQFHQYNFYVQANRWKRANFTLIAKTGQDINYDPPTGPPFIADTNGAQFTLNLAPATAVQIRSDYLLSRLEDPRRGLIFTDQIARTRINWQATRRFSVRGIVQYDTVQANPLLTTITPGDNLNFDVLVTFQVNPFSALYVGYNSDLRDPGAADLGRREGLVEDARQFFFKLSWLFSF